MACCDEQWPCFIYRIQEYVSFAKKSKFIRKKRTAAVPIATAMTISSILFNFSRRQTAVLVIQSICGRSNVWCLISSCSPVFGFIYILDFAVVFSLQYHYNHIIIFFADSIFFCATFESLGSVWNGRMLLGAFFLLPSVHRSFKRR